MGNSFLYISYKMYTKAARDCLLWKYSVLSRVAARFTRVAYPLEASKPHIVQQVPGQKHLEALDSMQARASSEEDYFKAMQQFVDFKSSRGDYFADIDGNTILDLNASAAGFALGYNNEDLVNSRWTTLYDRFVTHKVNVNALPTADMADVIRDNVMPSAPPGLG